MPSFTTYKGSSSGAIVQGTTTRQFKPDECLIKITHSGLCFTDVHYKTSDMVLGHEGVGVIEEVGGDVKEFKKGDRAGWGYNHSSCLHCQHCLSGMDTYCEQRAIYGAADLDQGSLATHYIGRESFLFRIPDNMTNEVAAPLMCGGATVFNALSLHGVKSTDRVGIIGVGGLGHLAIQFAAKMGCETIVFSGTDSKKEEAIEFGATEFYATKSYSTADELLNAMGGKKLDQLLVTTSFVPDWNMWLPVIRNGGILCPISVSSGQFEIPYTPLIMQGLVVWGTLVADRLTHKRMLEFAARHGIQPVIQRFQFGKEGIEEAFGVLESGKMRYRGVLAVEG